MEAHRGASEGRSSSKTIDRLQKVTGSIARSSNLKAIRIMDSGVSQKIEFILKGKIKYVKEQYRYDSEGNAIEQTKSEEAKEFYF